MNMQKIFVDSYPLRNKLKFSTFSLTEEPERMNG